MSVNFEVNTINDAVDLLIKFIPFLIPLALLQFGLMLFAIIDIGRKQKTKTLSPLIWVIISVLVNMIGPVLYLIFGRAEKTYDDDKNDKNDYDKY